MLYSSLYKIHCIQSIHDLVFLGVALSTKPSNMLKPQNVRLALHKGVKFGVETVSYVSFTLETCLGLESYESKLLLSHLKVVIMVRELVLTNLFAVLAPVTPPSYSPAQASPDLYLVVGHGSF
jgi:hypothetical protein